MSALLIIGASMLVSLVLAEIARRIVGIEFGWRHVAMALGIPAVGVPFFVVPMVMSNYRLAKLKREQERLARTDSLTGLPNRRAFFEWARHTLPESDAAGAPVTVMMIDIDHFKAINDKYGHEIGDVAIKAVAGTIRRVVEEAGGRAMVARVGGEEYAVMIGGTAFRAAAELAEAVCHEVRDTALSHQDAAVRVTVSVGLAVREPGQDIDTVLRAADLAAYSAKRTGRDRWRLASNDDVPHAPDAPPVAEDTSSSHAA